MNDIDFLYQLKQKILEKYRVHYPYYKGSIHDFGNTEITQLLDLVEQECQERVSEKWIYTHLKPQKNEKLPRKDMLNIFCRWIGYSGWDEFKYKIDKTEATIGNSKPNDSDKESNYSFKKTAYVALGILIILAIGISFNIDSSYEAKIYLNDKYTQKSIETNRATIFFLNKNEKQKLKKENNYFILKSNKAKVHLLVESPYYKTDTLIVNFEYNNSGNYEYDLQPDDYAMMLRAYMNANIDDWNRRKRQLNNILDDDAVIQEVMFEDIGVEFLNKQEFINKITTPTKSVKKMEVVSIEYKDKKIISLKYIQKK
ncbi:MAG: hypothetical protein BM557_03960 [Flavobacterium sp. MedPE-SWcel]|uniref:hypothetical protein n=1 Tax=uncultured Flavobacterium sp. TaxID=165435 RepID=UPI000920477E|nr:hypothetical protein [uncultured Flavobacterium sp.]OIQ21416.1 MAG: hypothetical protein BM557_03960 [Flavobacterium sp. MedPE-SWcel]